MQKMLHIEIYLRNLLESGCVMFEVSTKSGYPNFKGHKIKVFSSPGNLDTLTEIGAEENLLSYFSNAL